MIAHFVEKKVSSVDRCLGFKEADKGNCSWGEDLREAKVSFRFNAVNIINPVLTLEEPPSALHAL